MRTTRTPAQAEFHAQAQATYDYFGCHHRRQQESQEEALWVTRDYHYQALAAAAMLEGHIEWLSCSISWGWHGSQSQRQLGIAGGWEAGDAPEAMVVPGATEDVCWPDPKDGHPWWMSTLGIQPGGGQTTPALSNPGGRWTSHPM